MGIFTKKEILTANLKAALTRLNRAKEAIRIGKGTKADGADEFLKAQYQKDEAWSELKSHLEWLDSI